MRKILLATLLLTTAAPLKADTGAEVKTLVDAYWAMVMKESPIYASSLGIDDYASEVGDYSLAGRDRFTNASAAILKKLDAIDANQLKPADRIEYGILKRTLEENIEGNRYGQRAINFSTYSGWHQNFAGMADNLPFRNKADYESYNARLKQYARVNDESLAVANEALKGKYVLPCVVLDGYEKGIAGLIVKDERQSRYFQPYAKAKPAYVSESEWNMLAEQAAATIHGIIYPSLQKHLDWFTASYKPDCAKAPGVSAQPGGKDYYNFRIRQETTTNLTAEQIHALGLKEVARIRAEMVEVAKKAGYDSREAFIQHLRTDPGYYAKTPEELMEKVARVNKIIDGKMPGLFHRLPRLPYGIKEIPAEIAEGTTTAYYGPGSPAIGVAGFYYVNTSKLDQRPSGKSPRFRCTRRCPATITRSRCSRNWSYPISARTAPSSPPSPKAGGCIPNGWGSRWGCMTPRQGYGPPFVRDVARLPPCCRHRHPRQGLEQGTGNRLHDRQQRDVSGQYRGRGQPLYQLARSGAGLQAGRTQNPRIARACHEGIGRKVRPGRLPRHRARPGFGATQCA
jgi:uncharacterized protein (DUF885 family)